MCGRFYYDPFRNRWKRIPGPRDDASAHEEYARIILEIARRHYEQLREQDPGRHKVCPTQTATVIRLNSQTQGPEPAVMRWGLIPSWAKDASMGTKCFNARSETVHEKPAFRAAWRRRRCLIPATGFFEWKQVASRVKQPYAITRRDGLPLLIAGLWETWTEKQSGEVVESFTILTRAANEFMQPLHERMPVTCELDSAHHWLLSTEPQLPAPIAAAALTAHPVSKRLDDLPDDTPVQADAGGGGGLF